MASSQQLLFLSFWFLLLSSTLHIAISTQNNCPLSFCGDNVFPIKFPFQLTNRSPTNTSSRCVYPGFALLCNRVNQTILHLPDSGPFVVQNIDYITQSLWITDPRNCFPKRFLRGLSLKNSPFVTDRLANFTFVNCSSLDATAAADYDYYQVVSCLSGKNYTVLAGPTGFSNESMLPSTCVRVSTVMIPIPWGLWSGLEVGIGLIWRRPSCEYCEELGQVCEFKSSTGHETTCSELSSSGISRNTKYGIVLGVGVPALCCMIGFVCYLCSRIRAASQRRGVSVSSFNRPPVIISTGLDGPTIESYPKTLLGESKRLPKPNDNTCSICLCEYQAKESLRTIPQCNHYFHADCIDEWLKMKATCPVCRNSPDSSARGNPCSASTSSSSSRTSTSSSLIMS